MDAFATFIESDAFFPVLILLLVLLMFTFVSILFFGKNKAKRELQERKNVHIDENAQVQLVQHGVITDFKTEVIEDEEDEEIGSNEVGLVKEVEAVDLSEVEEFINASEKREKELDTKMEESELIRPVENMTNADVGQNDVNAEELNESEIVKIDASTIEVKDDEVEGRILPQSKIDGENNVMSVDSYENIEEKLEKDAFEMKANEDRSIHEDIKIESPKEYDGDKTEILEFPDFDFFDDDNTQKIETQIINQANKYIESVMESRDSHEE